MPPASAPPGDSRGEVCSDTTAMRSDGDMEDILGRAADAALVTLPFAGDENPAPQTP
ncbi:hypothetical protein GCM10009793_12780 [Brachybacterium phenoliresistens]